MWKLHIFVNKAYRNLVNTTFKGHDHTVTRRKVEKAWVNFLKTAAGFYETYFKRLQDLHGMPQIPRVNRVLQLAGPNAAIAQDSQVPTEALEKSFHSTLLHLGDISRWRAKAQSKSGALSTAVLYYELAHDLDPTSGLAHHQLGILEDSKHLQIVYHLYRAAAIESPHPNALVNLEQEFRKLSDPSQPPRTFPPDQNSAFAYWFSKLHAYLYKGEDYPQELEEEVFHRLETALQQPDALRMVLKMVLTNIAAYYIANARIQKEWSLEASASCQFILRLNVRWVLVLARLLQSQLQDFAKSAAPAQDETEGANGERVKSPARSSAFTDTILPLTRIYLAWLYIYRADLVDYQDHLGPYIFEMYKVLASSLTMMANEFNNGVVASSPYLLAEDSEALGIKPFDDVNLPPACNLHHDLDKARFKRHWEDSDLPRQSPEQEMLSRVYDSISCGFALALDERFPLSITSAPGKTIAVVYLEGGKTVATTPAATGLHQPTSQLRHQVPTPVQQVNNNYSGDVPQMDGQFEGPPVGDSMLSIGASPHPGSGRKSPTLNDLLEAEPNSGLKERMRSLVDDLLDDDSSYQPPQKVSTRTHSDGRPTSTLQASAPPFSPGVASQGAYEQYDQPRAHNGIGPGRSSSGFSGSGSSGVAHVRQRFGGSMDSVYSGVASYALGSPKAEAHTSMASGVGRTDGRVDSVSPPTFAYNSSWTRAFDPNASSLPPVNSPWGLPGAQPGAQLEAQPNVVVTQRGATTDYQHHPTTQNLSQHQMSQYQTISNGRAYNGTTAYGRGDLPTKKDPSYFRNSVQGLQVAAAVQDADAYDAAILQSAFTPKR